MLYTHLRPITLALITASSRLATYLPPPEAEQALTRLEGIEKRFETAHAEGNPRELRRVVQELEEVSRNLSARLDVLGETKPSIAL